MANNLKEIPKPTYNELIQRCTNYFSKHPMKSPEDQNDDLNQSQQFDPNIILNVYMWGSRVYRCARPDSDWDFLIVTNQSRQKDARSKQRMPGKGIGEIEKTYPVFEDEVVNGSLIPFGNFVDMVLEHRHEVLECLFLPSDMKLKEQVPIPFELDVDVLRRTVLWESTRRFHTARNKMRTNNIFKGKKELIHAIRYLMFASQITTHGSIIDYNCANELWHEILQDTSTDWEGYITKYERLLNEHKEKFKATCTMRKFYGKMETLRHGLWILRKDILKEMKTRPPDHPEPTQPLHNDNNSDVTTHHNDEFTVVSYLKQFGLEATIKKFSLTASRHREFSNLVHLVSATGYPWHSSVSHTDRLLAETVDRECQGLVLDESDQWRVICYPFYKLHHHAEIAQNEILKEKFSGILNWNKNSNSVVRIFEAVEGTPVAYFWYKDRWLINTLFECGDSELPACWKDERSICKFQQLVPLPQAMQPGRCYLFVFSHPNHRYVIKPIEPRLTLVGVFDILSGTRLDHMKIGNEMEFSTPREYTAEFSDLASVEEFTQMRNPFKHKGVVLCNASFKQMIKICSTKYATVAYATDWTGVGTINMDTNMDERMMLELIRGNKVNLFLAYFPEWRQFGDSIIQKYNLMCDHLQEIYDKFSSLHHKKKDFAEVMKRKEYKPISPVLFLVWEGSYVNIREYLAVCEEKVFHQFLKEYFTLMKQ